jgi:SNF2 family DNA or RNA helicase
MLQPSIRYSTDECVDLPDSTTQTRQVEMSKEQQQAYTDMLDSYQAALKEGTVTAVNEGARRIKLIQLAAGAVYDHNEKVHFVDCKNKLRALKEVIEEAGRKALVFVPFRHSIALLEPAMKKLGLTVGVVHGGVGAGKRKEVFSDFQKGDLNIILATPGCLAHGLTLTASHVIIWWGPVDAYRIYEQANGRIRRPGQLMKQTIVHLICSEVERKIYSRLQRKGKMQGVLLELLEEK